MRGKVIIAEPMNCPNDFNAPHDAFDDDIDINNWSDVYKSLPLHMIHVLIMT